MCALKIGDKAPKFDLPATVVGNASLQDFKGRAFVLYFYPKDNTSGCTKESCGFQDNLKAFEKLDVAVLGVSKDSMKSHEKFAEKFDLQFPLVSDEDCVMCADYGVWVEKSMYGRKYMGIERTTFLIDGQGRIANIWNKVKVLGHVDAVMDAAKELSKKAA